MKRIIFGYLLVGFFSLIHAAENFFKQRAFVKDVVFREYDIRGKVGSDLLIDQVYDLTRALIYYFKQRNPACKTIAVGMDGRTHSLAIKDEVCRAIIDSGLDVLFLGMCPTPALYYAEHTLPVDGGIMVTASHNTKEYNGLKISLDKDAVWGQKLQEVKKLYHDGKYSAAEHTGTITDKPIIPSYISWLVKHFKHLKKMNLPIVIDCGNGAGGTVIPELIKQMEWPNVTQLYCDVDGTYPNHEADPTVAENMRDVKKVLQDTDSQLGIGLDGDCDRMVPMTKEGFLVPGDQLLALFAQQVLKNHANSSVVFDILASSGLMELLKQWGAHPVMSPAGHAIIKEAMRKNGALLGGELSCHFYFEDRFFGYDDGMYAMLRLLEIIIESGKTLTELLKVFPERYSSRQFRLYCPDDKKKEVINTIKKQLAKRDDISIITMDGIRVAMPYGWGIVRASNTQPALSMRFESDSKEGLAQLIDDFASELSPHLSVEVLDELHREKGLL